MERTWAASHPSRRGIPRSNQVCPELEKGDATGGDKTFVILLSVYCQVD
jgi:hypothetical protein